MSGIVGGAGSKSGVIGTTELDYEEGTFEPTSSNATLDASNTSGNYVKVGQLVTLHMLLTYSSTSGSSSFIVNGMPFLPADLEGTSLINGGIFTYWTDASQNMSAFYPYINTGGEFKCFYSTGSGNSTLPSLANDYINDNFTFRCTITYKAAS